MNQGGSYTADHIARVTRVPPAYLHKILQALGRAGLVHSQRGLGGGFALTSLPADISVLTVVNAVDPVQRIRACPLGIEQHGVDLCPLHRRLDEALRMVESAFAGASIGELIEYPGSSSRCAALGGKDEDVHE
jgi:Rrf2 family transcriptional regulator, nitric oxide-sensitive transcriptional repressor